MKTEGEERKQRGAVSQKFSYFPRAPPGGTRASFRASPERTFKTSHSPSALRMNLVCTSSEIERGLFHDQWKFHGLCCQAHLCT